MTAAKIIDGKAAAERLRRATAGEVAAFVASGGPTPRLDVVLVGDHPASRSYVRTKTRATAEVGIDGRLHELDAEVSQARLLDLVAALNADPDVHGILVQLPLPGHVDGGAVLEAIDPAKDVDGFHPLNLGRLAGGAWPAGAPYLAPCTPQGCLLLLEEAFGGRENLRGRRAVVLGRSNIVGKPLALLLLAADCTVTVAHSRTPDLAGLCREAEILVAAVGRAGLVRGDWLRPGCVVIDVGISRVAGPDGRPRLVGDVAFDEAVPRAAAITPVPGGVGPMTVACLLRNTFEAARAAWLGARQGPPGA
jgi:methylenetetrahydrofolate dehydrogenase (NADP+)/methenyltetrahydrofolate cyclohydrolase